MPTPLLSGSKNALPHDTKYPSKNAIQDLSSKKDSTRQHESLSRKRETEKRKFHMNVKHRKVSLKREKKEWRPRCWTTRVDGKKKMKLIHVFR